MFVTGSAQGGPAEGGGGIREPLIEQHNCCQDGHQQLLPGHSGQLKVLSLFSFQGESFQKSKPCTSLRCINEN